MTPDTQPNTHTRQTTPPPDEGPISVEAEPVEESRPARKSPQPRRNISLLGWLAAILLFIINKKLGIVLAILLIIFRQYPTLSLKRLARATGKFLKELRSS